MRVPLPALMLPMAVILLLLGSGALPAAMAEPGADVVLVLDRGKDAESAADGDAGNVLRMAGALGRRGAETILLALGSDARNRPVTKNFEASPEAIEGLAKDEDYGFRGSSDVRVALERALAAHEGDGPVDVILIGPYGGPAASDANDAEAATKDPLAGVVPAWNEKAAPQSRILPVGLSARALAALAGARGLHASGLVVIGMGEPEVIVEPFSPLAGDSATPEALMARVRLLVDVLRLGAAGPISAVASLASDADEDSIHTKMLAGLHEFQIERRQQDGRTATLRFQPVGGESVVRLCDLPAPLTFRWDRLKPDVRLIGPAGEVPPLFTAIDVEVGTPRETAFRLRRSRTGPTPAWRANFGKHERPPGLKITIGDEVKISEEIAEYEVRLSFHARPARPIHAKGTILLEADGVDQKPRLPY